LCIAARDILLFKVRLKKQFPEDFTTQTIFCGDLPEKLNLKLKVREYKNDLLILSSQ